MLAIHRAGPDDWRAVRALRLRALADAPGAFASTFTREQAYDEAGWRRRVATDACFVAGDAGLAVGIPEPGDPDGRHLVSMWVAPEHRGRGVADRLVGAVVAWAREDGAACLALWVVDGNPRARRFYERLGFAATGERGPLPSDPSVMEARMALDLRP